VNFNFSNLVIGSKDFKEMDGRWLKVSRQLGHNSRALKTILGSHAKTLGCYCGGTRRCAVSLHDSLCVVEGVLGRNHSKDSLLVHIPLEFSSEILPGVIPLFSAIITYDLTPESIWSVH